MSGRRYDTRRIRSAEALALLAGAGLLIDLFLPWYSFSGGRRSAWSALTVVDVLLALCGLLALALFLAALLARSPAPAVALSVWLVPVGLVATIAALVRVLVLPGGAYDLCYGAPVGLAASALVLLSAWWSVGDERPARGVPVQSPHQ
ncbi:MAG: hypothetical protein ACR2ND_00485 [Solirubrobacteraceae bacterium]